MADEVSLLLRISRKIICKQQKIMANSNPEKLSSLAKYILMYNDIANTLKQNLKSKISQRKEIIEETIGKLEQSIAGAFKDIDDSEPLATARTSGPAL